MSIEFPTEAATCAHTAPAFGCQGCIDRDREAAIIDFWTNTPRPRCERHGAMMVATGDRRGMVITYECGEDEDCESFEEVPVR